MDTSVMPGAIGWFATAVLIATIGRQVYTQWRDKSCAGVSKWLFAGQTVASIGFVIYSWLLRDWVFVVANTAMLLIAILGQIIYLHNKRADSLT